ncbi:hypothetical protein D3C71_1636170 [compost metagenome]
MVHRIKLTHQCHAAEIDVLCSTQQTIFSDRQADVNGAGLIGAVPPDAKPNQTQAADMVIPHQVDGIGIGTCAHVSPGGSFDIQREIDVGRDQDQR